jgi:protein-disulfide isomerase
VTTSRTDVTEIIRNLARNTLLWSVACGLLVLGGSGAQADEPVAVVAGEQVTAAKLEELAGNQLVRLRAEEYAIRRRALDEYIRTTLLEKEAARRRIGVEELRRIEVEGKVKPLTDDQAEAILESRPEGAPPQSAEQVKQQLQQQRLRRREDEFMKELRERLGVKVLLEPPRVTLDPALGAPRGPSTAPVTVTVFSDFQCPYCAHLVATVSQFEQKYPGKIRWVFRDFPLPMHKDAAKAAEAGRCAAAQGKFWPMHDRMFANQRALDVASLKRYAGELGLDVASFSSCLDGGAETAAVQKDVQEGQRIGVSGTPTLIVNGRLLPSGGNPQALSEAVEEELVSSAGPSAGAR